MNDLPSPRLEEVISIVEHFLYPVKKSMLIRNILNCSAITEWPSSCIDRSDLLLCPISDIILQPVDSVISSFVIMRLFIEYLKSTYADGIRKPSSNAEARTRSFGGK